MCTDRYKKETEMETLRESLGPVGVWSMELRDAGRTAVQEAASELDELGFGALWLPGLDGDGVVDDLADVLRATSRAAVAMGILSIWSHEPVALADRIAALDDIHGTRVVTGLGVSNAHAAANAGQAFTAPTTAMRRYLDAIDAAPRPVPVSRRILGALGPKMVEVAAARAAGWHPFMVTPDYSLHHRASVGAVPVIAPHQAVVLESEPGRARAAARRGLGMFIGFPAYQANLRRLGFTDADLVPGGSDRLIDAVTAWGDLDDIARRIREHLAAGADHVALHVLDSRSDQPGSLPRAQWRELAALLSDVVPG
jgi:probable F420-dependent oxidoreductase